MKKKSSCNWKANCRRGAKLWRVVKENVISMAFPLSSLMEMLFVTEQSLNKHSESCQVAYWQIYLFIPKFRICFFSDIPSQIEKISISQENINQ